MRHMRFIANGFLAATASMLLGNLPSARADRGCALDVPDVASVEAIHPDCTDNPRPRLCSLIVQRLQAELVNIHNDFLTPTAEKLSSYYHPRAVLHNSNGFFRNRTEINSFFTGALTVISSIDLNLTTYRFQVIDLRTVIAYGKTSGTFYFKDGSSVSQVDLPQSLVWTCNDADDSNRPFLLSSQHE